jgi:hypothetical protein
MWAGGKSEFDEISNEYEKIKSIIISVFPKLIISISNANKESINIYYSVCGITHSITFWYFFSDLFIGKQAVLEVGFRSKVE